MSDFGLLSSVSRWGSRAAVAVVFAGLLGALCTPGPAHAQQMPQRTMPEYADTTGYTDPMASLPDLPPLQAVLDYATKHAPELMQQDAVITQIENQVKATQREWMQSVTVGAEATYGTFDEDQFVDIDPSRGFEEELNFNARARIGFNFSLLDLIGRDAQVAARRAELQAERHQLDVIRKTVREEVIDLYFNIRQFRTLVNVRSEDFRSTQAHLDFVETSFQQGSEEISEVSRVTEFASRAESRYQEARFSYLRQYRQLENFLEIDNLESLSNPSTASQ